MANPNTIDHIITPNQLWVNKEIRTVPPHTDKNVLYQFLLMGMLFTDSYRLIPRPTKANSIINKLSVSFMLYYIMLF